MVKEGYTGLRVQTRIGCFKGTGQPYPIGLQEDGVDLDDFNAGNVFTIITAKLLNQDEDSFLQSLINEAMAMGPAPEPNDVGVDGVPMC